MRRFRFLPLLMMVCALLILGRVPIFQWLGHQLILDEPPFKADAIFVLAGDVSGERVMKAVELYKGGWAPKIFVSSSGFYFDVTEGELAIVFLEIA